MYFIIAMFTHLFTGECQRYPYETSETKDVCCWCKKKMPSLEDFHLDNEPCKHGFRTDVGVCGECMAESIKE